MAYMITEACTGCGACVRICPVDAISGEKKEQHSIDPELCVECGACGRTCPQGGIVDQNGRLCIRVKKSQWAKPRFDLDQCMACIQCVETCPVGCLDITEATGGSDAYPYLKNGKACIACGFCAEECPVDAISMVVP